jgi:hypothetical protein
MNKPPTTSAAAPSANFIRPHNFAIENRDGPAFSTGYFSGDHAPSSKQIEENI